MRRLRSVLIAIPAAAVSALAACEVKGDGKGDTIAVPAAAVDTTSRTAAQPGGAAVTAGTPGAGTAATGASAATGVDTPITRRLREGEAKADSAKQAGAAKKP